MRGTVQVLCVHMWVCVCLRLCMCVQAQEDLNESRRIFDDLHNELCTELPDFYNRYEQFV